MCGHPNPPYHEWVVKSMSQQLYRIERAIPSKALLWISPFSEVEEVVLLHQ